MCSGLRHEPTHPLNKLPSLGLTVFSFMAIWLLLHFLLISSKSFCSWADCESLFPKYLEWAGWSSVATNRSVGKGNSSVVVNECFSSVLKKVEPPLYFVDQHSLSDRLRIIFTGKCVCDEAERAWCRAMGFSLLLTKLLFVYHATVGYSLRNDAGNLSSYFYTIGKSIQMWLLL